MTRRKGVSNSFRIHMELQLVSNDHYLSLADHRWIDIQLKSNICRLWGMIFIIPDPRIRCMESTSQGMVMYDVVLRCIAC